MCVYTPSKFLPSWSNRSLAPTYNKLRFVARISDDFHDTLFNHQVHLIGIPVA